MFGRNFLRTIPQLFTPTPRIDIQGEDVGDEKPEGRRPQPPPPKPNPPQTVEYVRGAFPTSKPAPLQPETAWRSGFFGGRETKGGVNPPNESSWRPPPPGGSGPKTVTTGEPAMLFSAASIQAMTEIASDARVWIGRQSLDRAKKSGRSLVTAGDVYEAAEKLMDLID